MQSNKQQPNLNNPDPTKFDLRTHIWDARGKLVKTNNYRKFIMGGEEYYERPVNSGNLWHGNNQPAGRMEFTFGPDGKISSKKLCLGEPHKEFTAPLSANERIEFEVQQLRADNERIAAELAAIKGERAAVEKKAAPNVAPQTTAPQLKKQE